MLSKVYFLESDSKNQKPSILVLSGTVLSKPQVNACFTFALKNRGRVEITKMISPYQATFYLESKHCHEIHDQQMIDDITQAACFLCFKYGKPKADKPAWSDIITYEEWNESSAACFMFSKLIKCFEMISYKLMPDEWVYARAVKHPEFQRADMCVEHYYDRVQSFQAHLDYCRASDKVRWAKGKKRLIRMEEGRLH